MNVLPSVNWGLATRLGGIAVPPGPSLRPSEMAAVVAQLREAADRAEPIVAESTRLTAPLPAVPMVLDRPGWVTLNVAIGRTLLDGFLGDADSSNPLRVASGAATGAQLGLALSLFGRRVLGQFDPFSAVPRLYLVAPNVAEIGERLGVDQPDFRLWVCVHEVIHRYQFGHAPWLADHLRGLVAELMKAEEGAGWRPGQPRPTSMLDVVAGPEGRRVLSRVTAMMSLLEGHADFMMDRTGAIASVADIRARFTARRRAGGMEALFRAVSGLDVKMAQYADGASFCREVESAIGVDGLNQAFEAPTLLPSPAEIADPQLWIRRMG